jgi:hypothetical protein
MFRPFTTWSDCRACGGLTLHHEEVNTYSTADRPGRFSVPEK